MEILRATTEEIRIAAGGKTITINGETMPPGGEVDFYADLASIRQWDDGSTVTQGERETILLGLPDLARRQGFSLKFD